MLVVHISSCSQIKITKLSKYTLVILVDVRLAMYAAFCDDVMRSQRSISVLHILRCICRGRHLLLNDRDLLLLNDSDCICDRGWYELCTAIAS